MTKKNELPSWVCQCCGKLYYDDFKETGYKCTECGAEYTHMFTVTKTVYNDDGTFSDEIVYETGTGWEDDKKRD